MVVPDRVAPRSTRDWRALVLPTIVALPSVGGIGVVAAVDPNQPGHYPTCPFLALTGLYCPGCGALRAVHDLAHGDLAGALARNPLAVAALAVLLVAFGFWTRRAWRGQPRSWDPPQWLLTASLAVVLVFAVLRNVPGWTWLSPA
jgi:hypothetical protein